MLLGLNPGILTVRMILMQLTLKWPLIMDGMEILLCLEDTLKQWKSSPEIDFQNLLRSNQTYLRDHMISWVSIIMPLHMSIELSLKEKIMEAILKHGVLHIIKQVT